MAKKRTVSVKKAAAKKVQTQLAGASLRLKHGYEVVIRKTPIKKKK